MPPVLTSLTLDPAAGERRGDVIVAVRFPVAAFADMTPEEAAGVIVERARAMALQWFADNGRKPDETAEQFVRRIRRDAVIDRQLTFEPDRFASVQEVA